jgi:hypothetical protein
MFFVYLDEAVVVARGQDTVVDDAQGVYRRTSTTTFDTTTTTTNEQVTDSCARVYLLISCPVSVDLNLIDLSLETVMIVSPSGVNANARTDFLCIFMDRWLTSDRSVSLSSIFILR